MYHKDYLIRTLQQFIVFLAYLAGIKRKNDPDLLQIKLENAWSEFTGLDYRLAQSLNFESLVLLLAGSDETHKTRILIAAKLLQEEGELLISTGNHKQAIRTLKRSSRLFELAGTSGDPENLLTVPLEIQKVKTLLDSIRDVSFD